MSRPIEIRNEQCELVAKIVFVDDPMNLNVFRTGGGFKMSLPADLSLVILERNEPRPLISNMTARVFAGSAHGGGIEIGRLEHEWWHSAGWSDKPGWGDTTTIFFTWYGTLAELAAYERTREGRKPELQIQLRGELSYLLPSEHPRYHVRTHPQQIYGDTTVSYPKETWVRELRKIGVLENVLVEVPLPPSPPAPWDRVWENLIKAREAFEQGGSTGWNGCVLAVRQALERWKEIEGEETGPSDQWKRSDRERLNNLRRVLHQCAHVWVHDHAECSREDAHLMLSTLSALLAERKP